MRAEFVVVLFGPFRGTKKSRLFAIPRAINNSALWFPAGFHQLTERPRFLQNCDLAGNGILRAVHPAIVMVAANHPLIRKRCTLHFSHHVANWLDSPV